jgi:hypothetical protein
MAFAFCFIVGMLFGGILGFVLLVLFLGLVLDIMEADVRREIQNDPQSFTDWMNGK